MGQKLYTGKKVNRTWTQFLYKDIFKQGLEKWIMIPVQYTTPSKRLMHEDQWMHKFSSIYNVQKFWSLWKSPFKDEVFRHFSGLTGDFVAKADNIIQPIRQPHSILEQLFFLMNSRKYIPKSLWDKVFQIVKSRFYRKYSKQLPKHLVLPYSYQATNLNDMKHTYITIFEVF